MATANPFRFSTKFQDDETGLLYYGYRYYDPSTGRWNSRDPIGEKGGRNLFAFLLNDPIQHIDNLGLEVLCYYNDDGVWTCRSPIDPPRGPVTYPPNGGSLDLLFSYLGFNSSDRLSQNMMLDVMNSPLVTSFGDQLLASARAAWRCQDSNKVMNWDYLDHFNSVNDGIPWASQVNWFFTGNWQLFLKGTCNWRCSGCEGGGKCKCKTNCTISGNLSKTFTLLYVGGNKWNIATSITAIWPWSTTFNVSEDFSRPRAEVGTTGNNWN